ncbi:hypothetical protein CLOM_g15367 [Closterium sp. NIES-68]|nr:hypothetical protein CLOM_g15367 [Closterium sp. NIES-68]GJP86611.1 hypothetical protein CLOP_g16612 [Closterium sp. NIES-67]
MSSKPPSSTTPLLLLVLLNATLLSHHLASAAGRGVAGDESSVAEASPRRQLVGPVVSHGQQHHRQLRNQLGGNVSPAAKGPCALVSCPKGCSCSASSGVAKCKCSDPCYGVKCPDVSKCAVQEGAVVCKCPPPFKRLINNKCSSASRPHSDYLDPHNAARAAVGAVPLVWDDAVAATAAEWAAHLASENNCGLEHGGPGDYGQCLSGASPSGWATNTDAVQWWVNEGGWCLPGGKCDWDKAGHYTQVVWNNSLRVGCAKASCGGDSDVWACNYDPPGNWAGEQPYVLDPCFRVVCPSTATCSAVDDKPVCSCPSGQALVNGKCQADACIGAAKCPGDLVCDGTSGAPKCVCPKGLVRVAPKTCLAPTCIRVACPAMARCRADKNGIPFCACPASYSLVNGTCTQDGSPSVTTSLALFNRPSFTNRASLAAIVLRAPTLDDGCINLPPRVAGTVGSVQILWDAPDGATGDRVACGLIWFWNEADCYGGAAGWYRPDNNVTTAKTVDGGVASVRSIACSA